MVKESCKTHWKKDSHTTGHASSTPKVAVTRARSASVVLGVMRIAHAYRLAEHGRRVGTPRSNPKLGSWVLWPSVVSVVWSVGTAGIGFLIGGFAMAIHSV